MKALWRWFGSDDSIEVAGVIALWALFLFGLAYHLGFIEFI